MYYCVLLAMGSWDGAEVCDIVGLYLLSQLSLPNIVVGLYRDDGLCATTLTARQADNMKKDICRIFKNNGLNIIVEKIGKEMNFLDINLDLETGIFKPFIKNNYKPIYVHKLSNHPPGIINNLPHSVNRRLSLKGKWL